MSNLTIVDLHQEEELSSSNKDKVVGGVKPGEGQIQQASYHPDESAAVIGAAVGLILALL